MKGKIKMKAETIFFGGPVVTVDRNDRVCGAAAVANGVILAAGTEEEIRRLADENTEFIDLKGRSLIPGIIDSHEHTAVRGMNAAGIDCRPEAVRSIEDIKERVREAAARTPKGEWIRGWGYNDTMLIEGRHPNRWDLDEAAPDHPVSLTRVCVHISANNSKALEAAGIREDSKAPEGGAFERKDGKISGVLFENAHMLMQKAAIPSQEEMVEAMAVVSEMLVSEGITTVHDSGGYGPGQLAAMQAAREQGRLKMRLYAMIFSFVDNLKFIDDMLNAGIHTGFGDDWLRLGPMKIMIDGSSSGPTAATREPYASNPASSGIMSMKQEEIEDIVLRAHKAGWQLTCHAVGDRAVETIIGAYEKALNASPRADHRHRVEHCAMMDDGLLKRAADLRIVPVPQPVFLYEFGDGYLKNYGEKRGGRMFPCRSELDFGLVPAGSSDCPITWSNPFLNMYMAVTRKAQTGQTIGERERITIREALRMFTINGAYASFEEDKKGSIEPGKLADLVVLSRDLYHTPDEEIRDIKADLTMVGGKIVFQRDED